MLDSWIDSAKRLSHIYALHFVAFEFHLVPRNINAHLIKYLYFHWIFRIENVFLFDWDCLYSLYLYFLPSMLFIIRLLLLLRVRMKTDWLQGTKAFSHLVYQQPILYIFIIGISRAISTDISTQYSIQFKPKWRLIYILSVNSAIG